MAYDKRQDSGELTPFSDNVMFRNSKRADATSVTINFPNTPRTKREVELYDLSKNFHSITGYDYTSATSLLTCVRFNDTGEFDAITTNALGGTSLVSFSDSSSFLSPPGAIFSTQVKSAQFLWDEGSGSSVAIEAADNIVFSPASYGGIFSISFWVYVDEIKENVFSSKLNEFLLFLNADGNIQFDIQDGSGNIINIKSSEVILPKTWTHITLNSSDNFTSSLDSSTVKLYINAKKDTDINITIPSSWSGLTAGAGAVYIGWQLPPAFPTPSPNNLSGMIAEFAMWSTRLDETEIVAIYDSSSGLSNKMDTSAIDEYRQGVSILTNKHKYSSMIFKLSSGQQRRNGHPDHYVEQREFGQPKAHVDGMAFNDIEGKFKPYTWNEAEGIKIINNEDTIQYPVAYSENLTDPSVFDGVIEPLVIRHAITNNAIDSPFHAHDVKGSIMGGNNNPFQGTELLTNDIKLKENINKDAITGATENYNPFYDSDEIGMEIESTGILVRSPGYISDTRNTDVVFDDVMRSVATKFLGVVATASIDISESGTDLPIDHGDVFVIQDTTETIHVFVANTIDTAHTDYGTPYGTFDASLGTAGVDFETFDVCVEVATATPSTGGDNSTPSIDTADAWANLATTIQVDTAFIASFSSPNIEIVQTVPFALRDERTVLFKINASAVTPDDDGYTHAGNFTGGVDNIVLEHVSDRQRYNNLIKSAQSGFVYSNNAKVGTDSLAFGGLTRK
jgi:hypothetical protein